MHVCVCVRTCMHMCMRVCVREGREIGRGGDNFGGFAM